MWGVCIQTIVGLESVCSEFKFWTISALLRGSGSDVPLLQSPAPLSSRSHLLKSSMHPAGVSFLVKVSANDILYYCCDQECNALREGKNIPNVPRLKKCSRGWFDVHLQKTRKRSNSGPNFLERFLGSHLDVAPVRSICVTEKTAL